MHAKNKNKLALISIVLLFVAPVVLALLMNTGVINLDGMNRKNQGDLLNPPVPVGEGTRLAGLTLKPAHWTLLVYQRTHCAQRCPEWLESLQRIKLSMTHRAEKLDVRLLSDDAPAQTGMEEWQQMPAGSELQRVLLEQASGRFADGSGVFIVSPEGYLMMAYDETHTPAQMIKDLKVLLKRKGDA